MNRVRTFLVLTAVVSSLILGMNASVQAATVLAPGFSALEPAGPFLFKFDENGHGTIAIGLGSPTPLNGILAGEPPVGAGAKLVLTYFLPEPVVTGDVCFFEPGTPGDKSDCLRFTDNTGTISGGATGAGARMIFYSDVEVGEIGADLADTGFPANIGTGNFLLLPEVGSEGNNGFDYLPGGVGPPNNNEYVGISDAAPVPEPSSLTLLASSLVAIGLIVRRRYPKFH
jgi:hypothetical protein